MITIESYKNIIIVSINKDKIDNFWELLENAKNKSFSSNNGKILQFIYNDISKVIIRDNNIIIFINSINFNTIRNIFKDYLNSKRIFPLDISLEQLGFIIEPEEVKDIVFECGEFDEELFSEACVQQLLYKENFRYPFKYQGQYYDPEIELCYNRFRYYYSETGRYISQDPIGFLSGEPNFFAYVSDTNAWLDVLGLFRKPINWPSKDNININMDHILSNHTETGSGFIQSSRMGGKKDSFDPNLSKTQIEKKIREAYAAAYSREKVHKEHDKNNEEFHTKHKLRGLSKCKFH